MNANSDGDKYPYGSSSKSGYKSPVPSLEPSTSSTPQGSQPSHTAAIAGGVLGGVIFLSVLCGVILWVYMRNKRRKRTTSLEFGNGSHLQHGTKSISSSNTMSSWTSPQGYCTPWDPANRPYVVEATSGLPVEVAAPLSNRLVEMEAPMSQFPGRLVEVEGHSVQKQEQNVLYELSAGSPTKTVAGTSDR